MNTLTGQFQALETTYPCHRPALPPRIRIGLVQLSTDFTLESDWHRLRGEQVQLFSTRLPFSSEVVPDQLRAMGQDIATAAALIAPGQPLDVMAYGCTSGSLMIGEERVARELTRQRPGVPATNPWSAGKAALKRLGARRIGLLTPYTRAINLPLFSDLQQAGFTVIALGAFQMTGDFEIPRIDPASIVAALDGMLGDTDPDAVFLSCTSLPALGLLEQLEQRFAIPMVCSNQAMFWHALRLAGSDLRINGFGRLLADC